MRFLLIVASLLVLAGCQFDPYAHLFTTVRPESADLVGRYTLSEQTVNGLGLAQFDDKPCVLELHADGTFIATNVPVADLGSPGPNFIQSLVSASGEWHIEVTAYGADPSEDRYWGIRFDSPAAEIHGVQVIRSRPPYGLLFTLGDPDSGTVMILERD